MLFTSNFTSVWLSISLPNGIEIDMKIGLSRVVVHSCSLFCASTRNLLIAKEGVPLQT